MVCVCAYVQISDYTMLPDTAALSEQLRVCLQEGDENPRDFTKLFDTSLYQLDTTALPAVIKSAAVNFLFNYSCILYSAFSACVYCVCLGAEETEL